MRRREKEPCKQWRRIWADLNSSVSLRGLTVMLAWCTFIFMLDGYNEFRSPLTDHHHKLTQVKTARDGILVKWKNGVGSDQ